jgi:hypothetical protein
MAFIDTIGVRGNFLDFWGSTKQKRLRTTVVNSSVHCWHSNAIVVIVSIQDIRLQ